MDSEPAGRLHQELQWHHVLGRGITDKIAMEKLPKIDDALVLVLPEDEEL